MTALILSLLVIIVIASRNNSHPWGEDFENKGKFLGTTYCDAGSTQFKAYDGPTVERQGAGFKYTTKLYTGMTITVNAITLPRVLYYIYSPNPDSISAVTFTFKKNYFGRLKEISQEDRDNNLKKETPNLWALLEGGQSDCWYEKAEK